MRPMAMSRPCPRRAPRSERGGDRPGRVVSRDQLMDLVKGEALEAIVVVSSELEEVVAMTDRVLEIRLAAPRPNLLALLAQPQLAILRRGHGTGPFTLAAESDERAIGQHLKIGIEALRDLQAEREVVDQIHRGPLSSPPP